MPDRIERLMGSLIQHGKHNDRVYLMKLATDDVSGVIRKVEKLAHDNSYSKICAKVPAWAEQEFADSGYVVEASVPGFYNGTHDGVFVGKFISDNRQTEPRPDVVKDVLTAAQGKECEPTDTELKPPFTFDEARESDAEAICRVYREVFKSYPFPIHDPNYIVETMRANVVYFCVRENGNIIAVASSEMDSAAGNVEMTDFATMPEYRGHGFAAFLLRKMEDEMRARRMSVSYTIARALSYGMNITFAKLGYRYAGTLKNNTNICGKLESMNVWHKDLD